MARKFVTRLRVENERVKFFDGGPIETDDLPPSGVVAGSFSAANITVNEQGLVTAAADGSGGGDSTELSLTFGWNNATPRTIGTVPAGFTVAMVRVAFTTPFTDPASVVTVGTVADPDAYMTADECDPLTFGEFETVPLAPAAVDTVVQLSITAGPAEAAGAGIVVVDYEPTSGG